MYFTLLGVESNLSNSDPCENILPKLTIKITKISKNTF